MSQESLDDLKYELELKNAEIDELSMELESKNEEINKLKLYSTKLKYEKKNLEDKLDTKIDYDKARINELDDLAEKIKEKESIIEDKQDQVKYLRSLIDDYKKQLNSNTENLEVQLKKISKTYEDLLKQKDAIIQKQDEQIDNLIKDICGVEFRNPLMLAAGIMGSNASSMNWILKSGAGGVVTKSFSLNPHPGYPNPTTVAVEGGILNAIGLSNPGVENFKEELKRIERKDNVVIASIYGATPDEFSSLVSDVQEYVDMIELNISCPHAMEGFGASIGQDCNLSHTIVSAAKDASDVPIIAKLTPNVTDITEIAKTCEDAGADAISLINTLGPGMKINIDVARPVLFHKSGGMSGRAIKPIAISNVYSVYEAVDIPLIGVGGIYTFEDVVEFIFAGARAVQIGTAIMDEGVEVFKKINIGLEKFMAEKGYSSIDEMVGLAHREL